MPMPFRLHDNALATMDAIAPLILSDQFATSVDGLKYLNVLLCDDLNRLLEDAFFSAHKDSIVFRMSEALLLDGAGDREFNTLGYIANHYCVNRSWFWYYVLIGGLLLLILLLIILVVLCLWYRRRKAQQMSLIVPDGRTYRETTIVMQVENHNLLKTDL